MGRCATAGDCYNQTQQKLKYERALERLYDVLYDMTYEPHERIDTALHVIREALNESCKR